MHEAFTCAHCGGPMGYLGTLGILDWYSCRNCGFEECRDVADREELDNE